MRRCSWGRRGTTGCASGMWSSPAPGSSPLGRPRCVRNCRSTARAWRARCSRPTGATPWRDGRPPSLSRAMWPAASTRRPSWGCGLTMPPGNSRCRTPGRHRHARISSPAPRPPRGKRPGKPTAIWTPMRSRRWWWGTPTCWAPPSTRGPTRRPSSTSFPPQRPARAGLPAHWSSWTGSLPGRWTTGFVTGSRTSRTWISCCCGRWHTAGT